MFQLKSDYSPAGDQPQAIKTIMDAYNKWENLATLLGATWTGKTFTMANVIQELQKPTLIISHNKTLAAQLATEFKHFFPNNAVHYFVSYFDYYQPESYLPDKDMYIEKEATINQDIQMYRLATMASLLSRPDVIVVASASSLYGLGQKEYFQEHSLLFEVGEEYNFKELKKSLLKMQYQPVQGAIEPGMFDFKWEICDIYSSIDRVVYRLVFDEELLERILIMDAQTFETKWSQQKISIRPATQYLQDMSGLESVINLIESETQLRTKEFEQQWLILEAQRINKRAMYDLRMIRETWFVNGIENYSPYFDQRKPGETPYTIFDYFPDDMLTIIDESHMTVPQLRAMPTADRARKINLINHGFRLPSAIDHRPLRFGELEYMIGWSDEFAEYVPASHIAKGITTTPTVNSEADIFRDQWDWTEEEQKNYVPATHEENQMQSLSEKIKPKAKTLFVSATPAEYEMKKSSTIAEQVIRPTGLLDPITAVYPKSGDYELLINSTDALLKKKPHLKKLFESYDDVDEKEIFN